MTAGIQIPGLKAVDQLRCTDPGELRRRAKGARDHLALIRLQAMNLEREADQLEHEARLWAAADVAEDALEALQEKAAGLEAAAEGTLAARRAAEDKLRDDKKHAARRRGEVTRAEHGASRDAQDEAAVRLHKSEQRVAEAERQLAAAEREHQAVETALDAHRAQLREAQAACTRAVGAGLNPGIAPRSSPLRPGIGRVEDMTPEERDHAALLAIHMGVAGTTGGSGRQEPARNRRTTNGEFAAQDPSGFRMIRQGNSMIAVPPAMTPSPGR